MNTRKPLRIYLFTLIISLLGGCTHTQTITTEPSNAITSKPCDHDDATFRCVKYVKNYDADTITVEIPNVHPLLGKNIPVRVNGIDAPELKGKTPCEKEAARNAQQLVESLLKNAKQIDLNNVGRDKYFRVLADVSADGQSVKALLLKSKLAYEYSGGTKAAINWCSFIKH